MVSVLFSNCSSLSTLGLVSIVVASISILVNSFPLYILLRFSWNEVDTAAQSFAKTVRIYLLALVITDIMGSMVVMPLLLVSEFNNMSCWETFVSYFGSKMFCALTYAGYFAYKLGSMFLVTFTGYSCLLHYNQNTRLYTTGGTIDRNNCACEAQVSLTTAASSQTNQSNRDEERRKDSRSKKNIPRRATMSFMLILIVVLSLFIAALPCLGLGPFNVTNKADIPGTYSNATNTKATDIPSVSSSQCTLHSFARPKMEKEYIFLFSLLMASGGCGLILVYIFVVLFGGRFKSSHSIFAEMTQFVTVQGFLFLATWIPILISICFAMSGKHVSQQIQSYLTLITFLNCLSHPFFYGYCLSMVRDGYKRMLKHLRNVTKCLLARNNAPGRVIAASEESQNATAI